MELGFLVSIPMERKSLTRLRPVTSRQNQTIKSLRDAFAHSGVTANGLYAIEGVRMVEDAIEAGWKLRVLAFSESARGLAEPMLDMVDEDTECIVVPDDVFQSAVATESPQGVAALIERKLKSGDELLHRGMKLAVVAVGIQDPGNLGTIIRSAEAFHADHVLLTENTVSVWNPKAVRASAGSVLRLACFQMKAVETLKQLKTLKVRCVGTSSHGKKSISQCDLHGPLALYIGNESAGLPTSILNELDELVTIPHESAVESLNAGAAASIALYEIARQRSEQPPLQRQEKRKSK